MRIIACRENSPLTEKILDYHKGTKTRNLWARCPPRGHRLTACLAGAILISVPIVQHRMLLYRAAQKWIGGPAAQHGPEVVVTSTVLQRLGLKERRVSIDGRDVSLS